VPRVKRTKKIGLRARRRLKMKGRYNGKPDSHKGSDEVTTSVRSLSRRLRFY
jgi:hypothetical protein